MWVQVVQSRDSFFLMQASPNATQNLATNFWYFITELSSGEWPGKIISANDVLLRQLSLATPKPVGSRFASVESLFLQYPISFSTELLRTKWLEGRNPRFFWVVPPLSSEPLRVTISHLMLENRDLAFWHLEESNQSPREFWMELMARLSHELSRASTALEAAEAILDVSDQLFLWDACHLNLYPRAEGSTLAIVNIDTIEGKRVRAPLAPPGTPISRISRQVLEQGPLLITSRNAHEFPPSRFVAYGDEEKISKSLMFVPIRHSGVNVGVLSFQSYTENAYTQKELESLQVLADGCGAALQRIIAQEELTKQAKQTALFAELGKKLGNAKTPRDAARVVAETADEFFGWDAFFVNVFDPETRMLTQVLAMDTFDGVRQALPALEQEPIATFHQTLIERGPLLILRSKEDMAKGSHYPQTTFGNVKRRSASLMYVPMVVGNSPVGILSFQSYQHSHYTEQHLEILKALGDHCCGALVRSLAEQRFREATEKLEIRVRERTEELNRSLQMLRTTLDATTDAIVLVDNQGRVLNHNQRWMNLFNLKAEQIRPNVDGILEVVPNFLVEPEQFIAYVLNLRKEGIKESFRVLRFQDGRIVESFSSLRELGGQRLGRVWSFRDITERHRSQEELARRENIYRKAIETSQGVPYTMYYKSPGYEFLGEGITQMVGYSPQEFTKKLLHEIKLDSRIIDPDYEGSVEEYNAAMRQGNVELYRMDIKVRTKDGTEKWINDTSVPLRDSKTGAIIGNIGILSDITTRKQSEQKDFARQQRLNQAEKLVALGTLVSGVAHEINNPNNFIRLNTPLLQNAWADALQYLDLTYEHRGDFYLAGIPYSEMRTEIPQLLKDVEEGSLRIKNIVQELGNFARGSADDSRQQVNLNNLVRSAMVLLQNPIKNSTSKFQVELYSPLPLVLGNAQRLEQVIINLIQNACQALQNREQGVRIWTNWNEETQHVEFHVQDEGIGIPKELLSQIADPFFTTKRDTGGTGLGLSISTNIVHEHGGTLDFDSEQFKGTHVTVRFPCYHHRRDARATPEPLSPYAEP